MLKCAVGAASLGGHVAVRDYLRECDLAADLTGDRNDYWLAFGPTNVAIHRVWLAVEMGDPTDALQLAALSTARASAPEQLMCTHRVHDMLRHLLRRDRRGRRELRELADFVGLQR